MNPSSALQVTPRRPDFHCTMLSQGKETWQMAVRLCRYWNTHSFFCLVPAVFSGRTWGLRLFAEALCWGPLVGPWPFWVAAHLMTLWVPVLRIWSPLTIPLLSSASPVETLKPEVNNYFLPWSFFHSAFYDTLLSFLHSANTFKSLKYSSFWKTKARKNRILLGLSHVAGTSPSQWSAEKTTHLNWSKSKGNTGRRTQNKPNLSKIM